MKHLMLAIIVLTVSVERAPAQGRSRRVTLADSVHVANNVYDRLFAGVRLSRDREAQARAAIRRAWVENYGLRPLSSRRDNDKYSARLARRDSVLRVLLPDSVSRRAFDARARAERPPAPPRG